MIGGGEMVQSSRKSIHLANKLALVVTSVGQLLFFLFYSYTSTAFLCVVNTGKHGSNSTDISF